MKKINLFPIALLFVFSLVGCANNNNDGTTGKNNNGTTNTTEENRMNDTTNTNGTTGTNDTIGTNDTMGTNGTNNDLRLSQDAADKITALDEVDRATVIVTDNNAYVGVTLKNEANAGNELESKIADEVKATDSSINNVYVSVNPDFSKQFEEYGNKLNAGEPVEGLYDEFSDAVQRAFPNAK